MAGDIRQIAPGCQSPHAVAALPKSFAAEPSGPKAHFSIDRRQQNLQPFKCPSKKSLTGLLNRSGFVVKLRALFDGAHIEPHQTLCRYSSAVVEQLTCNQQVPSSTLGGGTTFSPPCFSFVFLSVFISVFISVFLSVLTARLALSVFSRSIPSPSLLVVSLRALLLTRYDSCCHTGNHRYFCCLTLLCRKTPTDLHLLPNFFAS